jgi:hypothetical protein
MSALCYVCRTPVNHGEPGFDIRSPLCEEHLPARQHVISMITSGAVCECGWRTDIPYTRPFDREDACRAHWHTVSGVSA